MNNGFLIHFPGGRRKALSMSYDDGSEHDRRLVALFNAHGLKGSFHLNSSQLDADYRVRRDEVASLYAGHEIACHGATHADLTQISDDDVRRELWDDKRSLEDLTGGPVRGLAYAYGSHDDRVVALAREAGFAYARTAGDSWTFDPPDAPLRLATTCHHTCAMEMGAKLLKSDADPPQWMQVRGHSYELDGFMTADPAKDWGYMEKFCRVMASDSGIWHAPILAVLDYLAAAAMVTLSDDGLSLVNPSPRPVWIARDGRVHEIPAGGAAGVNRGQDGTRATACPRGGVSCQDPSA